MDCPLSMLADIANAMGEDEGRQVEDAAFEIVGSHADPPGPFESFNEIAPPSSFLVNDDDDVIYRPFSLNDAYDHTYGQSMTDFDRLVNSTHDYYGRINQMDFELNSEADHSYAVFLPAASPRDTYDFDPDQPQSSGTTSGDEIACQWDYCSWKGSVADAEAHVDKQHVGRGADEGRQCHWGDCEKQLTKRVHLLRHVRAVHLGHKPFACGVCGDKFALKDKLSDHNRLRHGREGAAPAPSYKCAHAGCDAVFTTAAYRRRHVDRVHSGVRLLCEDCGATFTDRSSWNRHHKNFHRAPTVTSTVLLQ